MALTPIAEIVGANDNDKNTGGLVILVKGDSGLRQEIGRVAFERSNGLWKDKTFDQAVDEVIERTKKSIDAIRELTEYSGQLV